MSGGNNCRVVQNTHSHAHTKVPKHNYLVYQRNYVVSNFNQNIVMFENMSWLHGNQL